MPQSKTARSRNLVRLPFFNVRQISCPEDAAGQRKIYVGHTPVQSIVDLPTDENVRDYLLEAEGRKRRRPSQVHKAIRDTLENYPGNFSVLNSGVVIVARACEIDETQKSLLLRKPSIINGSQTQGQIKDFIKCMEMGNGESPSFDYHIKFEVVVTGDEDLIAQISIARNLQNDVASISIAGRLGELDELDEAFQSRHPGKQLQKSETKLSDDYVKTERLLQVITALIPEKLWPKTQDFNKVFAYSMKAKCLKQFREVYAKAKDPAHQDYKHYKELYQFYLDVAAEAYSLYEKWKCHQGFQGTGLHSIEREGRSIMLVPDGLIFPILASLSAFAVKVNGSWSIRPPKVFSEDELILSACAAHRDIANHNPWIMGKSRGCYSALYQITSLYARLSKPA